MQSDLLNNKDNKSCDKKWQGLVSSSVEVSWGQFVISVIIC